MHIFGTGDSSDYFMITVMILVGILILFVVIYAAFYSVDYVLGKTCEKICVVDDVTHTSERTEIYYNAALRVPSMRVIPDHWELDIKTPEGIDDFRMNVEPGAGFQKGKEVLANYRVGGITGTAIVIHWVRPYLGAQVQ